MVKHPNFLYHDQNEIGCLNSEHQIEQLRLLGLGKGAEIGAAVAIELIGILYAPLHDITGSVIALLDIQFDGDDKNLSQLGM